MHIRSGKQIIDLLQHAALQRRRCVTEAVDLLRQVLDYLAFRSEGWIRTLQVFVNERIETTSVESIGDVLKQPQIEFRLLQPTAQALCIVSDKFRDLRTGQEPGSESNLVGKVDGHGE